MLSSEAARYLIYDPLLTIRLTVPFLRLIEQKNEAKQNKKSGNLKAFLNDGKNGAIVNNLQTQPLADVRTFVSCSFVSTRQSSTGFRLTLCSIVWVCSCGAALLGDYGTIRGCGRLHSLVSFRDSDRRVTNNPFVIDSLLTVLPILLGPRLGNQARFSIFWRRYIKRSISLPRRDVSSK